MSNASIEPARGHRIALAQLLVLIGLTLVLYWPDLRSMAYRTLGDLEAAHSVAGPVLVLLLVALRWPVLRRGLGRGSPWGLVLLLATIMLYVLSSWPFNYGTPRWVSLVPALGGVVLTVCGWKVFFRILPVLLLVALTIPVGSRYYARFIIKPETVTLDLAATLLDLLPGVLVYLEGPDLLYLRGAEEGSIALGEPHRGASLLLAYLTVTVFVTFTRIRPWWQIVIMAVGAIPIVLICNLVRLIVWGLVTIYAGAHPASGAPRIAGAVSSLLLAYGLALALLAVTDRLVSGDGEDAPAPALDPSPGGAS